MEKFFSRLKELLGNKSESEFARMIGVRQQTLNNYMNGREPPARFVHDVCAKLGVSADWLLGLREKGGAAVVAANSTVAAFGGSVAGGDCSRCPLMLAAREALAPKASAPRAAARGAAKRGGRPS